MLHVTGAQISLNRERGVRQGKREERWKRIVHRQWQSRQREEDVVVEEWRVEVKRFSRSQWRLIVVDSITTAQHCLLSFTNGPGEAYARRKIVFVCLKATAWDS